MRVTQVTSSTQGFFSYNEGLARHVNVIYSINRGGRGIRSSIGYGVFDHHRYRFEDYGALGNEVIYGICGRCNSIGDAYFFGQLGGMIKFFGYGARYNGCGNGLLILTSCDHLSYGLDNGLNVKRAEYQRSERLLSSCGYIGSIGY